MLKSNVIRSFAECVSGTVRVKVNVYYDVMVGALHVNSRLDKISEHERKTEQVLTCKKILEMKSCSLNPKTFLRACVTVYLS